MSVAHCYPSQIESRGRNLSPLIARARVRRIGAFVAAATGAGLMLMLLQPSDVSAGSDALHSASLRPSIETTQDAPPAQVARKPVRVIAITKADEQR
jgi:hypothetical protein